MATQIQVRRDSAADWTSNDPTLAEGEIGYETDTGYFKIGDGSTVWTTLGYSGQISGAAGAEALKIEKIGLGVAPASMSATGLEIYNKGTTQLQIKETGDTAIEVVFDSSIDSNDAVITSLLAAIDGTSVAGIRFSRGDNATSGYISFITKDDANAITEVLRIEQNGFIGVAGATQSVSEVMKISGPLRVSSWVMGEGGIYAGGSSTNNLINDSSSGAGSTVLYIGNKSINTTSDKRVKKNIEDTKLDALDLISKFRVVDFEWDDPTDKSENNKNARGKWTGMVAQEVIDIAPWMVNAPRDVTKDGKPVIKNDTLNDDGTDFIWQFEQSYLGPVLVEALKKLIELNDLKTS